MTSGPLSVGVRSTTAVARDQRTPSSSPWPVGWLLALGASTAAGLLAVIIGWFGASGQGTLALQLPYLNVAVAGAVVAGLGNCGWLLCGRRSVGLLRRALLVAVPEAGVPAPVLAPLMVVADGWVMAPGMSLRHTPSCLLVAGKAVAPVSVETAPACAVCGGSA